MNIINFKSEEVFYVTSHELLNQIQLLGECKLYKKKFKCCFLFYIVFSLYNVGVGLWTELRLKGEKANYHDSVGSKATENLTADETSPFQITINDFSRAFPNRYSSTLNHSLTYPVSHPLILYLSHKISPYSFSFQVDLSEDVIS